MERNGDAFEMSRRKQTFCAKSDEAKFKIILVGDSSVGKTSILMAFTDENCQGQARSSVTTVDFRLQPLQIQGQIIKLHIWDTAGQQKYRSIVESYFKGCQGAIIVFDLSRKQSFVHATSQWFKICQNRVSSSEIILIGNKSDLVYAVTEQQVRDWSKKNGVVYFFSSAIKSQNIEQPFVVLSKKMLQKKRDQLRVQLINQVSFSSKEPVQTKKVDLTRKLNPSKKKGCC